MNELNGKVLFDDGYTINYTFQKKGLRQKRRQSDSKPDFGKHEYKDNIKKGVGQQKSLSKWKKGKKGEKKPQKIKSELKISSFTLVSL